MVEATPRVASVHLRPASQADQVRGLVGWLRVELVAGLTLDGLTLRRSRTGHEYVAYPAKKNAAGERRYLVRPTDEAARLRLEHEILATLGWGSEGSHSAGNGAPDGDPSVRGEQPS